MSDSPTILVVEDNPSNRQVALQQLGRLGYAAEVAMNGREALDRILLADHGYRLVLMDCQMPEMDGFAATAAIRASPCGCCVLPDQRLFSASTVRRLVEQQLFISFPRRSLINPKIRYAVRTLTTTIPCHGIVLLLLARLCVATRGKSAASVLVVTGFTSRTPHRPGLRQRHIAERDQAF